MATLTSIIEELINMNCSYGEIKEVVELYKATEYNRKQITQNELCM